MRTPIAACPNENPDCIKRNTARAWPEARLRFMNAGGRIRHDIHTAKMNAEIVASVTTSKTNSGTATKMEMPPNISTHSSGASNIPYISPIPIRGQGIITTSDWSRNINNVGTGRVSPAAFDSFAGDS